MEGAMPTAQLLDGNQKNATPSRSAAVPGEALENEDDVRKQDGVKFKWAVYAGFGSVFEENFMQMNPIIPSLLKKNISPLECLLIHCCEFEFSPEL